MSRTRVTKRKKVGRFELHESVGRGAFGTVYRATDLKQGRLAAVKIPHSGLMSNDYSLERFLREAKATSNLQHDNIVTLYEAGRHKRTYYIASQFIEGEPLSDALHRGPLDARHAARIASRLAEALDYAHQQGIIHRDVKPANVMLDRAGEPHLMDFGLARLHDAASTLTREGGTLGTPAYMSPEQAKGQAASVTAATDQYSLGATLYEMLTGQLPFSGPPTIVIFNVINTPPPVLSSVNPDVPMDLEAICLRAMGKGPEARFQTCGEMAAELNRWLGNGPSDVPDSDTSNNENSRFRASIVACGVAVLLATFLLFAFVRKDPEQQSTLAAVPKKTNNFESDIPPMKAAPAPTVAKPTPPKKDAGGSNSDPADANTEIENEKPATPIDETASPAIAESRIRKALTPTPIPVNPLSVVFLNDPHVQKELRLTLPQRNLMSNYRAEIRKHGNGREAVRSGLENSSADSVNQLNPRQRKRFDQMIWQKLGGRFLLQPGLSDQLRLSTSQRESLARITTRDWMALLTPSQQEAYRHMVGEPFDWSSVETAYRTSSRSPTVSSRPPGRKPSSSSSRRPSSNQKSSKRPLIIRGTPGTGGAPGMPGAPGGSITIQPNGQVVINGQTVNAQPSTTITVIGGNGQITIVPANATERVPTSQRVENANKPLTFKVRPNALFKLDVQGGRHAIRIPQSLKAFAILPTDQTANRVYWTR